MKLTTYSHNFGSQAISEEVLEPLLSKLAQIEFKFRENTATELREAILNSLIQLGWSDQVKVEKQLKITITSMRRQVGLCLQLGNMARFYADLLKLEVLHQKNTADCAIYILPKKNAATALGSNIAHFERMTEELKVFKHIITIPIAVIGIEQGEY